MSRVTQSVWTRRISININHLCQKNLNLLTERLLAFVKFKILSSFKKKLQKLFPWPFFQLTFFTFNQIIFNLPQQYFCFTLNFFLYLWTNIILQIGTLLYCTRRGQTKCCFHNHHCDSFDEINSDFSAVPKDYMQNKVIHSMSFMIPFPTQRDNLLT